MRVAVEEPVPEDHRHPRVGHPVRELRAAPRATTRRGRGRGLRPVEAVERQQRGSSCSATRRAARRSGRRRAKLRRNVSAFRASCW